MRALILRHGTINRRVLMILTPLFCCFLAMAFKGTEPALLLGIMLALSMSTFVLLTQEAMDPNLERFLLSLPVKRSDFVREAYFSGLMVLVVGQCLPLLVVKAFHALMPGRIQNLDPSAWGVAAMAFLALACLVFFMLPFRFAWGGPKGLMVFSITLVAGLAGILTWKGFSGCMDLILKLSDWMLQRPTHGLLGTLCVVAFGSLSLALSTRAYARRSL